MACIVLGVIVGDLFMRHVAPALWDYPLEFQLVLGLAVFVRFGTAAANWCSKNQESVPGVLTINVPEK